MTLVADTNILVELFLPTGNATAVQAWWAADGDWRFPGLWVCEFRHIHLKYLRVGRLELFPAVAVKPGS